MKDEEFSNRLNQISQELEELGLSGTIVYKNQNESLGSFTFGKITFLECMGILATNQTLQVTTIQRNSEMINHATH